MVEHRPKSGAKDLDGSLETVLVAFVAFISKWFLQLVFYIYFNVRLMNFEMINSSFYFCVLLKNYPLCLWWKSTNITSLLYCELYFFLNSHAYFLHMLFHSWACEYGILLIDHPYRRIELHKHKSVLIYCHIECDGISSLALQTHEIEIMWENWSVLAGFNQ